MKLLSQYDASEGSGAFFVWRHVRVNIKRTVVVIPAFIVATSIALFGFDSLTAQSVRAPIGKPARSVSPTPQASPSITPTPTEPPSPAPASPTPRVTTTTVRRGNTLTIPSIGLTSAIQNVGVTSTNAIDVPARQVGFWTGSAQPGTPGAAFLDGHVEGVFARLNRLTIGQTFSVTYSGQTFRYQVAYTETVQLAGIDMNRALSTYNGAAEGLNIMTCAGNYISSTGTYDQRFIVYAVRV